MTEKTKRLIDQRCIIDGEIVYIDLERQKDPKNYGYNLLSLALEKKDVKAVRYLTLPEIGINIDAYKDGYTLLHVAAQENDTKTGELLIKCGADIETTLKAKTDNYGDTALHLAVQKGHKTFVKLLLNNKVNVNSLSSTGSEITPLHDAAYYGHVDVAQLLIEHGATVNAKDRHNYTPLMFASANGKSEIVKLLLQQGADPYLKNNNGETALYGAADNNHLNAVSALVDVAEDKAKYINAQNNDLDTALHVIAYNKEMNKEHKKVIKLLLENGADSYTKNNQGKNSIDVAIERKNIEFVKLLIECEREKGQNTALYETIKQGNLEKVKFLIECEADVNAKDKNDSTALHLAIGNKQLDIAKLLIKHGADVNAKTKNNDKDDLTPIHLAIFAETPEFIELLSSKGAKVNERESTEGHTPLHFAALYGNTNIIQTFVDKGENIEDKDNNGLTALFLAIRQCTAAKHDSRIEVIKYLVNKLRVNIAAEDHNNNTVLFLAANNCPGEVVEFIIKQYIKNFGENKLKKFIHHKNKEGMDALDIAFNSGNEEAVEVLRSYGIDVENKINGESRLLRTVKEGNTEKVKLLLKHGALVDTADDYNLTPIYFAIRNDTIDIVNLLLQRNASVNLNEKEYGYTPLHIAVLNNRKEAANILLNHGANLYAKDNDGKDVTDIAKEKNNIYLVTFLLKEEKKLIKNKKAETFLHRAVDEGKIDKVKLLIQNRANINAKDAKGLTPLDLAMQKNDQSITQSLKENGAKTSLELKIAVAVLITLTIMTLGLALAAINVLTQIQSKPAYTNLSKQKDISTNLNNQVILQKDNVLNKI